MNLMEFSEWITRKYIEWRGDAIGQERSITKFADSLGVSRSLLTQWMQPGGKVPNSHSSINALVTAYGIGVYDILGLQRPAQISIALMPQALLDRLNAAHAEVFRRLQARHLDGTEPEAKTIMRETYIEFGFNWSETDQPGKSG